ncbi:MAG: ROK family protein [Actinomycetaceae bacterium]|nr:ROK family protein [Actinomycetaceae bacterium]
MSNNNATYGAIDIGGTKVASAIVNFDRSATQGRSDILEPIVIDAQSEPTHAKAGGDAVLKTVINAARRVATAAHNRGTPLNALGIGSAGVIDPATGSISQATDVMPGWKGQPLRHALQDALDIPVTVINDVGAHALCEATFGAARYASCVVMAAVGTGLGGAIVIERELYEGRQGVAGHIGHIVHPLAEGLPCSCGSHAGHIEAIASGYGLCQLYHHTTGETVENAYQLQQMAENGNKQAAQTYTKAGQALGETLAGIANTIDPDMIVLSGSVVKAGSLLTNSLREGFADTALPLVRSCSLRIAERADHAALIGAAFRASHSRQ